MRKEEYNALTDAFIIIQMAIIQREQVSQHTGC